MNETKQTNNGENKMKNLNRFIEEEIYIKMAQSFCPKREKNIDCGELGNSCRECLKKYLILEIKEQLK